MDEEAIAKVINDIFGDAKFPTDDDCNFAYRDPERHEDYKAAYSEILYMFFGKALMAAVDACAVHTFSMVINARLAGGETVSQEFIADLHHTCKHVSGEFLNDLMGMLAPWVLEQQKTGEYMTKVKGEDDFMSGPRFNKGEG